MTEDIAVIDSEELEHDVGGTLGDATWSSAYISSLPDAAFAAIDGEKRHLPHHDKSVVKGTENKSVDVPHLKAALSRCDQTDMPGSMKKSAKAHLRAHARAMGIGEAEVADLIGESANTEPAYQEQIEAVDSYLDAEDLLLTMLENGAPDEFVTQAEAKVKQLVPSDEIIDLFEGELLPEQIVKGDDQYWHFTARVAQADVVNTNKRLYPTEEFTKNLPRVNRRCRARRFTGRDGHASMFGADKMSETVICYESFMMQGGDLIASGFLLPTQAGQDIAAIWDAGVNQQFSIVGYGNAELVQAEDGTEYSRISNYLLESCDPVRHGAASTRTLKVRKPKDSADIPDVTDETAEAAVIETEIVVESVSAVEPQKEPIMGAEPTTPEVNVETINAPAPLAPAPVDINAIVNAAVASAVGTVQESAAKIAAEAAVKASAAYHEGQEKSLALKAAKDAAIASLAATDPDIAAIVGRHFADCADAEAVSAKITEITPQVESLKRRMKVASVGIHSHAEKETAWFSGSKIIDRPETAYEVKMGLMEGLEDTGEESPANPSWGFKMMLDNYEKMFPQYFNACTRRGFMETATTSTVLGTTLPYVLPLIRQVWPKLIPYELQSVQPLNAPTGRVYFLDFEYDSGTYDGSSTDDSAALDTAWADHVEGATKSKMALTFTSTDITAYEKSIYYDITSVLMQDMRALYNLDAEAELMRASANQIAREINLQYLETIAAGAGISAGTYGIDKPTAWNSQEKWYDQGLAMWVNHAGALIGKKFYTEAEWMFCSPTQAQLFASTNKWESNTTDVNQFGYGIRKLGTYQGKLTIYSVSWGEVLTSVKNKMVFGFYPSEWMYTGAVFAPYVPLYISPQDSDASKNTLSRSVSSRNAMKVLQANAFSTLTVADSTGTEVTMVD